MCRRSAPRKRTSKRKRPARIVGDWKEGNAPRGQHAHCLCYAKHGTPPYGDTIPDTRYPEINADAVTCVTLPMLIRLVLKSLMHIATPAVLSVSYMTGRPPNGWLSNHYDSGQFCCYLYVLSFSMLNCPLPTDCGV